MARKQKLTDEQVWVIQQNVGNKKLKEYVEEFGVSYATIHNIAKGKGRYANFNDRFTAKEERDLMNKYFPAHAQVA